MVQCPRYARFLFANISSKHEKTREELKAERRLNEKITFTSELVGPLHKLDTRLGYPDCEIVEEVNEKTGETTGRYKPVGDPVMVKTLRLSAQAKDALDEYGDALTLSIQNKPQHTQVNSHYGRFRTFCLQIATLFAALQVSERLAKNVDTFTEVAAFPHDAIIEESHVALAQQYCEMFRASLHELVDYLHDDTAIAMEDPYEGKIKKALREKGSLTANDIRRFTNIKDLHKLQEYISLLKQANEIEEIIDKNSKNGRVKISYKLLAE